MRTIVYMVKSSKQRQIRIEFGSFEFKMFEIDGNIHYQQILKHLHPIWHTLTWISCKLSKFSNLCDKSEKLLILLRIAVGFGRIMLNCAEFVRDWCNIMYYINLKHLAPKCTQLKTIQGCLGAYHSLYSKIAQTASNSH